MSSNKSIDNYDDLNQNAILNIALHEKINRNKSIILQNYEINFKKWEISVLAYIETTNVLNKLLDLVGQQSSTVSLRASVRKSELAIASINKQLNDMIDIIDTLTQHSNINYENIQIMLSNHETRINKLLTNVNQLVMHRDNRRAARIVHTFKIQLTRMKQKINFVSNKIPELTNNTLKTLSDQLHYKNELNEDTTEASEASDMVNSKSDTDNNDNN